jgi:hypothetical protein
MRPSGIHSDREGFYTYDQIPVVPGTKKVWAGVLWQAHVVKRSKIKPE